MNLVDFFLIVIVLIAVYNGWLKGFIVGTLELVLFVAGILVALFSYPYIAALLEKYWSSLGIWIMPLSFIIGLVLIRIILSFLANQLLKLIPATMHTNSVNRVMGFLPGFINGTIWATIIAALMFSVPLFDGLSDKTRQSFFAGKMADKVEWLDEKLSPVFDKAVNKTMNKLMVNPGSEKSISLHFTSKEAKVREDLELKMLDLVNEERKSAGLQILKFDNEMLPVARSHSRDMLARGYFSHVTPEGLTPFNRIRKAKVRFLSAGENLALGQTLNICHRGLMNSPGHRANILSPAFGRVGIAVLDAGIYGLMITQNFRN